MPKTVNEMTSMFLVFKRNGIWFPFFLIAFQFFAIYSGAQVRQVFVGPLTGDFSIKKISFYSRSEGYVAFRDRIGYSVDTGHTFTYKYINTQNVNYNGYAVPSGYSFNITGVKAFDKDNIVVYGDYDLVPSILISSNGGNSFKLVFYSRFHPFFMKSGITDMIFPENNNVGYAVDGDRLLKTTDRGATWLIQLTLQDPWFSFMEAVDNNVFIAYSKVNDRLYRTTNGGVTMEVIPSPPGYLRSAHFITANKGWVCTAVGEVHYTSNGGASWRHMNTLQLISGEKMRFINDSTGYITGGPTNVAITTDSGKIWEPMVRQTTPGSTDVEYYAMHFWDNQQFWVGGFEKEHLYLTTNGGGVPIPVPYFYIDTTGLSVTNTVSLVNQSKPTHQFKWYRNDTLISTNYHASYQHRIDKEKDTITLVVTNGPHTVKEEKYQFFNVPPPLPLPTITRFTPSTAAFGDHVWIDGTNFIGTTNVTFGGVPALSFIVASANRIDAIVDHGATGNIAVTTAYGTAEAGIFTFIEAPVITAFAPLAGNSATTVTITGSNFTGVTAVQFGDIPASSFTVESPTVIKAIPGASGASGNVTVIGPGGVASLGAFTYRYPPAINGYSPSFGPAGTVVTITGAYFTGVTAVDFGGVPVVSFTVLNDNTITATVGNGAAGNITITSPNGSTTGPWFEFKVPPSIISFTPSVGTQGTVIYITGTDILEATSVTIGGIPAASFTFTAPDVMAAIVGGNASGDIVITTPYGSATKGTFTWMPAPVITSFTPTSGVSGTEVTINGSNFDSVTNVTFGGERASSFTIVSGTTIKAIVHLGATGELAIKAFGVTFAVPGFTHIASGVPVITSFTPVSGPAGSTVTITGTNFSPNPTNNTVYFGAVKAAVTQAAATSLKVTVPAGATWQPIAVTSNYLTNYADKPFVVTYPGINGITPDLFNERKDFPSVNSFEPDITHADMDGDGLPDLLMWGAKGIYRNNSANGNVVFSLQPAEGMDMDGIGKFSVADMDGDGKIDIVTANGNPAITIYRNISSNGIFRFEKSLFTVYYHTTPRMVKIADITSDGLPDILFAHDNELGFLRNTTTGGQLSFEMGVILPIPVSFGKIDVADLDKDGKPDVVVTGDDMFYYTYGVAVFKNDFIDNNSPVFTPLYFPGRSGHPFAIADFDGDGKQDLVACNFAYDSLEVYRNTSVTGAVSFAHRVGIATKGRANKIVTDDVDGDGKPDLSIIYLNDDSVTLHKNLSGVGSFAFGQGIKFALNGKGTALSLGDLDGDGRIDMTALTDNSMFSIFRHALQSEQSSDTIQVCSGTDTVITSNLTGGSYQWQQDAGNGFSNLSNDAHIAGVNSRVLQLNNIQVGSNGYKYRCVVNGANSHVVTIAITNAVTPVVTIAGESIVNQGTPVNIVATFSNGGTTPTLQWQEKVNGAEWQNIAGTQSTTISYLATHTGDQVRCILASNATCASVQKDTSNTITFTVNAVTAVDPEPALNYGIKHYPNPVEGTLYIRDLALGDKWETLDVSNLEGKHRIISKNINGQTNVALPVNKLPQGLYVAVIRSRAGKAVYLKFMKM